MTQLQESQTARPVVRKKTKRRKSPNVSYIIIITQQDPFIVPLLTTMMLIMAMAVVCPQLLIGIHRHLLEYY